MAVVVRDARQDAAAVGACTSAAVVVRGARQDAATVGQVCA